MYKKSTRQFARILLTSQLIIFFAIHLPTESTTHKLKSLLPKEINKTEFKLSLKDFKAKHPNAQAQESGPKIFRYVFLEEINSKHIKSVVYYFDASLADSPLYEIIVNYNDEATMELQANVLLGESNYAGKDGSSKEWKFELKKENLPLHCWTFKNKIIYVLPLKGSEWNENGEIDL